MHVSPYMHSGFVAMLPCPSQPPPSHCRQMDNDMSEIAQGNRYDKPNHRMLYSNVICTISHYYKTTRKKSYWSKCIFSLFEARIADINKQIHVYLKYLFIHIFFIIFALENRIFMQCYNINLRISAHPKGKYQLDM